MQLTDEVERFQTYFIRNTTFFCDQPGDKSPWLVSPIEGQHVTQERYLHASQFACV